MLLLSHFVRRQLPLRSNVTVHEQLCRVEVLLLLPTVPGPRKCTVLEDAMERSHQKTDKLDFGDETCTVPNGPCESTLKTWTSSSESCDCKQDIDSFCFTHPRSFCRGRYCPCFLKMQNGRLASSNPSIPYLDKPHKCPGCSHGLSNEMDTMLREESIISPMYKTGEAESVRLMIKS